MSIDGGVLARTSRSIGFCRRVRDCRERLI